MGLSFYSIHTSFGPIGNGSNVASSEAMHLELMPNPASDVVTFRLEGLAKQEEVSFLLYNSLGQLILQKDFGKSSFFHEQIDLSAVGNGLYLASIKAGGLHIEQKLVINRN